MREKHLSTHALKHSKKDLASANRFAYVDALFLRVASLNGSDPEKKSDPFISNHMMKQRSRSPVSGIPGDIAATSSHRALSSRRPRTISLENCMIECR